MTQVINNLDRHRVFTVDSKTSFRLKPRETKEFTGTVTQEMLDNVSKGYIFITEETLPTKTKNKKKER